MSDSPKGAEHTEDQPEMVSIPEMPDRIEAAGLKRVEAPRIRQLAASDPEFPHPVYARGRTRLWDWPAMLRYFRTRVIRQGERTDLSAKQFKKDRPADPGHA